MHCVSANRIGKALYYTTAYQTALPAGLESNFCAVRKPSTDKLIIIVIITSMVAKVREVLVVSPLSVCMRKGQLIHRYLFCFEHQLQRLDLLL